jgi:uncharacterized protein YprB with RNaseH-like and TPR domain
MNLKQRLAQLKPAGVSHPAMASPLESMGDGPSTATTGMGFAAAVPVETTTIPVPLAQRFSRHGSVRKQTTAAVSDEALAALVGGRCIAQGLIEIDQAVALPSAYGRCELASPDGLQLPYVKTVDAVDSNRLVFLDTETTGLAGGTGTLPFLIGLARFEGQALRVRQLFLTGFHGEPALLAALRDWITPQACIVSFNGKTFDVPLLATRFRLARMHDPLAELEHIDLLHPTRNAFARRWEDCRLQTAEALLLGLDREDDLPGHLIPYAWFNFIRSRTPGEVPRILEHNHWDVLSLAALLVALAEVYADPRLARADTLGVARAHRRRGAEHDAVRVLASDSECLDERGLLELAALHRRRGEWQNAVALWQ